MKCILAALIEGHQKRQASIEFLPENEDDQKFLKTLAEYKFAALTVFDASCHFESVSIHLSRPLS
jgi:hypothetical protein